MKVWVTEAGLRKAKKSRKITVHAAANCPTCRPKQATAMVEVDTRDIRTYTRCSYCFG